MEFYKHYATTLLAIAIALWSIPGVYCSLCLEEHELIQVGIWGFILVIICFTVGLLCVYKSLEVIWNASNNRDSL